MGFRLCLLRLSLLREHNDVLVSKVPDKLPPERKARDGAMLEYVIETAAARLVPKLILRYIN
jgi:hypothetical protein